MKTSLTLLAILLCSTICFSGELYCQKKKSANGYTTYPQKKLRKDEYLLQDLFMLMDPIINSHTVALKRMAADFAITDIMSFVAATQKDSPFIIRMIYMDNQRRPWAYASAENPTGTPSTPTPLNDSISIWCTENSSKSGIGVKIFQNDVLQKDALLVEYCAPVKDSENKLLGYVRYTVTHRFLTRDNYKKVIPHIK